MGRRTGTYATWYKARILAEYDRLDKVGKSALLRREGLSASLISRWRNARDQWALADSAPPGRPTADPRVRENDRLRRENKHLTEQLERARGVTDVRGRLSALFGPPHDR